LCEWFIFCFAQMGVIGIHVEPLYSSKGKVGKILQCFKSAMAGEIHTSPSTHALIISEAQAFDPTRKDNVDDIWDTLHMAHEASVKFRHLMIIPDDLSLNVAGVPTQTELPPPSPF
jgi:hypothetical protein